MVPMPAAGDSDSTLTPVQPNFAPKN